MVFDHCAYGRFHVESREGGREVIGMQVELLMRECFECECAGVDVSCLGRNAWLC